MESGRCCSGGGGGHANANANAVAWTVVALVSLSLLVALNALQARMRVSESLVDAVATCDRLAWRYQSESNGTASASVGAFFAFGGTHRPRAAEEALRRFRQWYPLSPVLMHAESDAVVTAEMRRHVTQLRRLPPRQRFKEWGSSYASPEEFVDMYWHGLVRVARQSEFVVVVEEDVWVLRPLRLGGSGGSGGNATAAWTPRQKVMPDLAAAARASGCSGADAFETHAGAGGTVLRSEWIVGVRNETVLAAASLAFRVAAKWRVPSDAAIWATLACSGGDVQTPPWMRTVRHTLDGVVTSVFAAPPPQTETIEAVAMGEVAVLHKVKTLY